MNRVKSSTTALIISLMCVIVNFINYLIYGHFDPGLVYAALGFVSVNLICRNIEGVTNAYWYFELMREAFEDGQKAEREACAETAEAAASDANKYDIAKSVRARSDA